MSYNNNGYQQQQGYGQGGGYNQQQGYPQQGYGQGGGYNQQQGYPQQGYPPQGYQQGNNQGNYGGYNQGGPGGYNGPPPGPPPPGPPGGYNRPPQGPPPPGPPPPGPPGGYNRPPQGPPGGPNTQDRGYGGGYNGGPNYYMLLKQAVQQNELGAFYGDQQLQQIAQSLPPKIQQVAQRWKIPMSIANDLARLALYDIVLYLDDSGSMKFDEGGERIEDLKVIVSRTAFVGSLFDHNGIQVRFMNSDYKADGIRDDRQVLQMISKIKFDGITPLGSALKSKVLDPLVLGPAKRNALLKPVLVITVTDGEPTGESAHKVFKVIESTKKEFLKSRYRPGACSFQFAQVGNDMKARAFLEKLDTDPTVGKLVDCTSNFEIEQQEMARAGVQLDPATWLVKMLLGSIDPSYDTKDEKRR